MTNQVQTEEWADDQLVEIEKIANHDRFRHEGQVCEVRTEWTGQAPRKWYISRDTGLEIEIQPKTKVLRLKKKGDPDQGIQKKNKGISRFFRR